jgi:DNA polymerase-3 subunit delta
MRINSIENLEKNVLKPVYLLSSDEPLLRDEALKKIKERASAEGYQVSQSCDIAQLKWDSFFAALQQNDLFSEKKIFIVSLLNGKLNADLVKAFTDYFSNSIQPDTLIIFVTKKLDAASLRTKWLEALDKIGCVVQLFAPESSQLKSWISKRVQQKGLALSSQALDWIVELTTGNLTASHQVIERLGLEYESGSLISDEQIRQALFDSSQYSIYDLVDNWLKGDLLHCLKILRRLKQEAAEPVLILWALMMECRILVKIQFDLNQNKPINTVLSAYCYWPKKIPLIKESLTRQLNYSLLLRQYLAPIEFVIKGAAQGNVWDLFENFLMRSIK